MVVAHLWRSPVAKALPHNLQGFSQQVDASPRGGAEGVVMVHQVACPLDGVIRVRFCKQSIAGTQRMLSHGWVLRELGVGAGEHYILSLLFPHDGIEPAYLAYVLLLSLIHI